MPKKTIELKFAGGRTIRLECGNFTYQSTSVADGGPYKVQLLEKEDRQDATNEPFAVFSGVLEFRTGVEMPAEQDLPRSIAGTDSAN